MDTNRFKQLLESSLGNVKPLITESSDSSCLMSTGFVRDSIGGPMTKRIVLEKEKNGVTYQIGLDSGNQPNKQVRVISNSGVQSCMWSCDTSSPIGIKLSGCKKEVTMPM